MNLSAYCTTCNQTVTECEAQEREVINALMLHAHNVHSTGHFMIPRIDGQDVPAVSTYREVDIVLKCLHQGCCAMPAEYRQRVPLELTAAVTIAFHGSHEGHALWLEINGVRVFPP